MRSSRTRAPLWLGTSSTASSNAKTRSSETAAEKRHRHGKEAHNCHASGSNSDLAVTTRRSDRRGYRKPCGGTRGRHCYHRETQHRECKACNPKVRWVSSSRRSRGCGEEAHARHADSRSSSSGLREHRHRPRAKWRRAARDQSSERQQHATEGSTGM